jgi:SAP domain
MNTRANFLQIHQLYEPKVSFSNQNIAIPIYPLARFCKVLLGQNSNGDEDVYDKFNEEIEKAQSSIDHGIVAIGAGMGPLSLVNQSMLLSHVPVLCRSGTRNNSQKSVTSLINSLLAPTSLPIIDWTGIEDEIDILSLTYSLFKRVSDAILNFHVNPSVYLLKKVSVHKLVAFPIASIFEPFEEIKSPVFQLDLQNESDILMSSASANSEFESGKIYKTLSIKEISTVKNEERLYIQKASLQKKQTIMQTTRAFRPLRPEINKLNRKVTDKVVESVDLKVCNHIACCMSYLWFDPMFTNFSNDNSQHELGLKKNLIYVTCCQKDASISTKSSLEQWLWRDNIHKRFSKDTFNHTFMRIQTGGECLSRLALFQRADVRMLSQGMLLLNEIKKLWISLVESEIPIPIVIMPTKDEIQSISDPYCMLPTKLRLNIRMDDSKDLFRDQAQNIATIAGDIVRPLSSYGIAAANNSNDENPHCHAAPIDIDASIIYQNDSKHLLSRLAGILKERGTVVGRTSVFRKFITGTAAMEKMNVDEVSEQGTEIKNEFFENTVEKNKCVSISTNSNPKTTTDETDFDKLINSCNGDAMLLAKKCEIKHLKEWLRKRKEKVSGTKTELIDRIVIYLKK